MIPVLVCGGRRYDNRNLVFKTLYKVHEDHGIFYLINGWARGADELARDFCWQAKIPCWNFPADWDKEGLKAGFLRNIKMLNLGKPKLIIAFPGGPGTADMIRRGKQAGVTVQEINDPTAIQNNFS
jgi:hypothetical protein